MSDLAFDLTNVIFSKTPLGQQEIQTRSLSLTPLVRRVLVLIDGQRRAKELEAFVLGHDITLMLKELLAHGCIDAKSLDDTSSVKTTKVELPPESSADLSGLPIAEMRGQKEVEMARNFMMNTINNTFGQHTRLSMIKSIIACTNANELREVYPAWVQTMSGNAAGVKSLPEMRKKLFTVL